MLELTIAQIVTSDAGSHVLDTVAITQKTLKLSKSRLIVRKKV